jgi:hypothetical protein
MISRFGDFDFDHNPIVLFWFLITFQIHDFDFIFTRELVALRV